MNVIEHYDLLIDENNDPFHDSDEIQMYMDQWDGAKFLDAMSLSGHECVLEIGVGTGRLACRVAPKCNEFVGIDISPKTICRAITNLSAFSNVRLICADFLLHQFSERFDIIYSSLTLFHFEDKMRFFNKVASLMTDNSRFVLSIDKSQNEYIDMGTRKLRIYPDNPSSTKSFIYSAGLRILSDFETELAHVFIIVKK